MTGGCNLLPAPRGRRLDMRMTRATVLVAVFAAAVQGQPTYDPYGPYAPSDPGPNVPLAASGSSSSGTNQEGCSLPQSCIGTIHAWNAPGCSASSIGARPIGCVRGAPSPTLFIKLVATRTTHHTPPLSRVNVHQGHPGAPITRRVLCCFVL